MAKKQSVESKDKRPRFGWAKTLDDDPQIIHENKLPNTFPIVVIPLPFMSPKMRRKIREFVKAYVNPL